MAEKGSQKWVQKLINEKPTALNNYLIHSLNLPKDEQIKWLSPLKSENYVEYHDSGFLQKIGKETLTPKLLVFWPNGGPRWDALGVSASGLVFLVEAKSHIPELISMSKAEDKQSIEKIHRSLGETKRALGSKSDYPWTAPFYQYANRLAHVHFLKQNNVNAYFVSIFFVNDHEVSGPETIDEWKGAIKLVHRYLGLREPLLQRWLVEVFFDVSDL
jgi:hypothetical protein